jgi:hypothetical protein
VSVKAVSRRALVPLDRQPSLTERVLRQLRDAIVRQELIPGQSVAIEHVEPEGDYSEMFGPDVGLHDFVRRTSNLPFLNVLMDTVQIACE